MAEKRMFTQKIVDSDAFLDMPLSSQALYFHLNMRADDDGFVNNPKRVMKLIGASEDDLKILLIKRFIIGFESGVIVIKHWRMHNTLKSDRYHPTDYQEELAKLWIKPNKSYTDHPEQQLPATSPPLEPTWNQSGTNLEPEISIDLVSGKVLGKAIVSEEDLNIEKHNKGEEIISPQPLNATAGTTTTTTETIQRVINAYQSKMGTFLSDTACRELISFYLPKMGEELTVYALDVALNNGNRKWQYIRVILNSWIEEGFSSVAEVVDAENERKRLNAGGGNRGRKAEELEHFYRMAEDWANG